MTVVVDLGCLDFGSQDSIGSLIDEYKPSRVYGFDPHSALEETITWSDGVRVELRRQAAWLYDGEIHFHENLTKSTIFGDGPPVPCFDFSSWLRELAEPVVLKMDVEGAEYDLLEQIIDDGADVFIEELVVEWHDDVERGQAIVDRLACPVKGWWM